MTGEGDPYLDAETVLTVAAGGDPDAVVGAFDEVVGRRGLGGVYQVSVCLAATMVGDAVLRRPWTLDFPGIDEATYDTRWVARFVSAYVNADPSTGRALFTTALGDGQLKNCLLTLAGSTLATLGRRASPAGEPDVVTAPPSVTAADT